MENHFQKLAADVGTNTIEMCLKILEMHHIRHAEGHFDKGYNTAIQEIAAKLRAIKEGKV